MIDARLINEYGDELVEAYKEYYNDGYGGDNSYADYLGGRLRELGMQLTNDEKKLLRGDMENELGISE